MDDMMERTVLMFLQTIQARDPYTAFHCERVSDFAIAIAREIGLSENEIETLRTGSLLHDLGKIGIRDAILFKPGELSDDEFEVMKKHPVTASQILNPVTFMMPSIPGILHHHERIGGTGYPDGLKGDQIPLHARIIVVAECFDTMTTIQSYRPRIAPQHALELMMVSRGTQFDSELMDVLSKLFQGRSPD